MHMREMRYANNNNLLSFITLFKYVVDIKNNSFLINIVIIYPFIIYSYYMVLAVFCGSCISSWSAEHAKWNQNQLKIDSRFVKPHACAAHLYQNETTQYARIAKLNLVWCSLTTRKTWLSFSICNLPPSPSFSQA